MPNYGNKLTVAAADEPPYLTVGTDVSAKYKGAFCEAKIIDVNKHVKLRVLFDGHPGSYMIDDTELKQASPLEIGSKVEARHPEKKQQIYINATIQKILDQSRYTVVFDDGDQCILRRNSICLKSGKHFAESETLDQLPLTNPEHFGNPVKVGQASLEQNNHNNSTNHSLQQVSNHSTNKLSNNITNNNNNNSGGSNSGKNGYADFNNQSSSTADKNGKVHNNVKLETEKQTKGKSSISSPSNTNSTSTTASSTGGPPGRRGGGKGRKRRESTSNNSKQASELDDEPGDDSQDSADIDPSESDVDFSSIEIGVKLMVQYGKGKVQNVYEAKVNKIETNSSGRTRYYVHYTGWNNRYDEWITRSRILALVADKDGLSKDSRSKQAEPSSISANSNQISSSEVTVKSEPTITKDKEKDKEVKQPAKTPRRSRHPDVASSPVAAPNHVSSAEPPSSSTTSTVATNKQGVSATPSREKDRDRDKEREKEIPSKTRRTRLPVDNATSASSTDSSASEPKVSIKREEDTKEKDRTREREKTKDKEKEKIKDKESAVAPLTRPGRPRLNDAISTAPNAEKAQAISLEERERDPPAAKTRRSRHAETASSANATPAISSASSTESSTPPRSEASHTDRDRARDLEKEPQHSGKESRSSRQVDSTSQNNQKSNNNSSPIKDRDSDKELSTPAKTRASKQTETKHTTSSLSSASTTVSSSSLSSVSSVSTATTTTSSIATTASFTGTTPSTTTTSDTIPLSTSSVSSKDREKEREKEREKDRDRDKEPPTKIRRSRQSAQEAIGNVSSKDTSATASTNNATTTTITTSTASSTSSTASSSSSSSYTLALTNPALSALASLSEREREKFDDALIIDEPDCDKRISILQDKIMTIRQTYMALKTELADLDRRRKRPRMERSSSDHINNFNSSVTCRN